MWFKVSLSRAEVVEGHVDRIEDAFAELLIDAGAPPGAAMFGAVNDDGAVELYFSPPASEVAQALLRDNGAAPCLPPVNEGDITLLVGDKDDQRLLSS
jgi:hypothetical protein